MMIEFLTKLTQLLEPLNNLDVPQEVLIDVARKIEAHLDAEGIDHHIFENETLWQTSEPETYNLYIWQGVGVLCDYTCGVIFALGRTESEAHKAALARTEDYLHEEMQYAFEHTTPDVYPTTEPFGFALYGGS